MVYHPDRTHHQHPHYLECPRCAKHTIVVHGETRYVCLNCSWQRNIEDEWALLPLPAILLAFFVVLLIVL